jgi:RimJ/RimL family protein N-acetyltransferase
VIGETGLKLASRQHCGLGWHRVTGSCDARNQPPARLMERLGMRREAHFAQNMMVKGALTASPLAGMRALDYVIDIAMVSSIA